MDFRRMSGSIIKAEVSLGNGKWVQIHHQDTTSLVPLQSGEDHFVLEQRSFTIRLTNAKGEQISCPDLSAASWNAAQDNWLACPDASFQFSTS
jgi:hypothetical protein